MVEENRVKVWAVEVLMWNGKKGAKYDEKQAKKARVFVM